MCAVLLSMTDGNTANEMLIALVKTNPESAAAILKQLGKTDEESAKILSSVQEAIVEENRRAGLNKFKEEITTDVLEFANDWYEATQLPEGMTDIKVVLHVSTTETKITADQIMQPGPYVSSLTVKYADSEKWINLSRIGKAKAGGKGTGRKGRVPVPQSLVDAGTTSWSKHYENEYPEEFQALKEKGASYSAPRKLEDKKDPVFLLAKADQETVASEATEEAQPELPKGKKAK